MVGAIGSIPIPPTISYRNPYSRAFGTIRRIVLCPSVNTSHGKNLLIQAGFEIVFSCTVPTPMHLQVHVRPEREVDLLAPEQLVTNPFTPYRTYIDSFGNRCT